MRILLYTCTIVMIISLSACTGKSAPALDAPSADPATPTSGKPGLQPPHTENWRDAWGSLSERLQQDGFDPSFVNQLFQTLDQPPSTIPMNLKVRELYSNKFLPRPTSPSKPKEFETKLGIPGPWFRGVVTAENARTCKRFIEANAAAFALAEARYGVPSEVAAALLFVETRLGGYLGKYNAFYMLASMSVTRTPESIPDTVAALPGANGRLDWIRQKMAVKADWAYAELKALLRHCCTNNIDPLALKGSVYGAIGLCQFMPSNLPRYAVDGDGDHIVNLFTVPDAVASLSNYLFKNGWKTGLSIGQQTRVLRRYNAMNIYAHTILALARTIQQLP